MEIIGFYCEVSAQHVNASCRKHNLLIAKLVAHTVTSALHRVKHHIIKMYRRVEIHLHSFLTSALDGIGEASYPDHPSDA